MIRRRILGVHDQIGELPWIEKYRPKMLEEVVGHDKLVGALSQMIRHDALPHLLFYGAPGTGKTSTILAVAREYYKTEPMMREHVLELNASDDRGIGVVREQIVPFATSVTAKPKLLILDESDQMTFDAQNALKRLMETAAITCRFCLICNDVSKIVGGVADRCEKQLFGSLSSEDKFKRCKFIVAAETLNISDEALAYLCNNQHDFRQVINKLQYLKYSKGLEHVTIEDIARELKIPAPAQFELIVQTYQLVDARERFQKLYSFWQQLYFVNQTSLVTLVELLIKYLRDHPTIVHERKIDLLIKLINLQSKLKEGDYPDIALISLATF